MKRPQKSVRQYKEELIKIYSFLKLSPARQIDILVRGNIMVHYVIINVFLDICILRYFYPSRTDTHYIRKRSQKYKSFISHFLQAIPLLNKVKLLKTIIKIPKRIVKKMERINALRNTICHEGVKGLFPGYVVFYKNKDIFSLEGLKLFNEDSDIIQSFLQSALREKSGAGIVSESESESVPKRNVS